jgi:hypothetical protein
MINKVAFVALAGLVAACSTPIQRAAKSCAQMGITQADDRFAPCIMAERQLQIEQGEAVSRNLLGAALAIQALQPQPIYQPTVLYWSR